MKYFLLPLKQGMHFFFSEDDPEILQAIALCQGVPGPSAAGPHRGHLLSGQRTPTEGRGGGEEQKSRLCCLLFHPDLVSYNESSIWGKKIGFLAQKSLQPPKFQVCSIPFAGFQGKRLDPGIFHLDSMHVPSGGRQAEVEGARVTRQGSR